MTICVAIVGGVRYVTLVYVLTNQYAEGLHYLLAHKLTCERLTLVYLLVNKLAKSLLFVCDK